MKTMRTKIMVMVMVVALAMSGCMKIDQAYVINEDGSATITADTYIDREKVMEYQEESNGAPLTEEEIEEIDASMVGEGYTLIEVDEKLYYYRQEIFNYTNEEVNADINSEDQMGYVSGDTFFVENIPAEEETTVSENGQIPMDAYIEMTATVEFKKPIVSTTGTIDAENPNKVSFDLTSEDITMWFATTNSQMTEREARGYAIKNYEKETTTQEKETTAQRQEKETTSNKVVNNPSNNNVSKETVKAPKIKKLKANKVKKGDKKATATLKIAKVQGASKYYIQYGTKKNFKKAKKVSTKKTTYKLKKLKKGKKYYVRVRAMKKASNGEMIYSKWVKKTVKTKK